MTSLGDPPFQGCFDLPVLGQSTAQLAVTASPRSTCTPGEHDYILTEEPGFLRTRLVLYCRLCGDVIVHPLSDRDAPE